MNEDDKRKGGISSFVLRVIACIILAGTVVLKAHFGRSMDWVTYVNWLCYPIFAFLLAEGFEQTSSRLRYFLRLLLFAFIAEIPFNLLVSGSLFYAEAQNGMFTLCLAFLAMCMIDLVYKKTYNVILTMAAVYVYGWGAYYASKILNCEFYSYGVMFVLIFFVSNQVKYPKLLQLGFMALLALYISSEAYISFIIGYIQYTIPYRSFAIPAMLLTWFYKGKRGPNSLGIKIFMYAYYPLMLLIVYELKHFGLI